MLFASDLRRFLLLWSDNYPGEIETPRVQILVRDTRKGRALLPLRNQGLGDGNGHKWLREAQGV